MEELEEIALTDDPYQVAGGLQILLRRHDKLGEKQVYFWVVALNEENDWSIMELIAQSPTSNPVIEPMDVFIIPRERKMAGIIIISNHLDATTAPTPWDKKVTKRLVLASKIMNIPLLDHLIINQEHYYSFKASGLLGEIEDDCGPVMETFMI